MEILLDAEVKLSCDYRGVSQRKLYRLEGRRPGVRQPRERSPQVVRADHSVELVRISLHNHEDALRRDLPRREAPVARDAAENSPFRYAGHILPAGDGGMRP